MCYKHGMSKRDKQNIGLALGGGGVRGLAHIPVLAYLDTCNIVPHVIAGTSMGAIMGAMYASGKSGQDIRRLIQQHIVTHNDRFSSLYAKKDFLLQWLRAFRPSWTRTGIIRIDGFLQHLIDQMHVDRFEELQIPLQVVATDFHTGTSVIFDSGPLLPALKASISIPGIFQPVRHEGKVLFDGGISNNLPYDILMEQCDTTIAVDVAPTRASTGTEVPNMIDATAGMFEMLMERATRIKIETQPPTVYFHPKLHGIRMLEFHKAEDVFQQAAQSMPELQASLETARIASS